MENHNLVIISDGNTTNIMIDGKTIVNVIKVNFTHSSEVGLLIKPKLEITYDGAFPVFGSVDEAFDFKDKAKKYMEN